MDYISKLKTVREVAKESVMMVELFYLQRYGAATAKAVIPTLVLTIPRMMYQHSGIWESILNSFMLPLCKVCLQTTNISDKLFTIILIQQNTTVFMLN